MRRERTVDVLIVGAGPAGLAAALHLAAARVGVVEVLERDQEPGGVPRHCDRGGFGAPWTSGPTFAHRLAEAARYAGARIRTSVTATALADAGVEAATGTGADTGTGAGADTGAPRALDVTGPEGLERISARAVVLATGARERPRAARLVPGTRPGGIWTTGELQRSVHSHGLRGPEIGRRAVVVGAEPVAYAALDVLRRAGVGIVAQVTEEPASAAGASRSARARLGHGVPLLTDTAVTEVLGHGRLSGVRVRHRDGRTAQLACDTLVFTGDFVPDHELARHAGIPLDPGTRGPGVDAAFRTAEPGVFAAGNVLHAAEPVAVATAEGFAAAAAVLARLAGEGAGWPAAGPAVEAAAPLRWVTPNRLAAYGTSGRPWTVRADRPLRVLPGTHLLIVQDGRVLHRARLPRLGPAGRGRTLRMPGEWTGRVDPKGGTVALRVD